MASDTDFLATARKRFAAAAEDEKHLREKFVSDLKFASPDGDDQWDPQVKMQREAAGRPAMSFPRCHTFVQQVSNEARQNKPQIKFSPRLDGDKDTADIYEGLARYIQYTSDAQIAYETAIEYSAGGSFGYYRFLTDYVDDESDDLDLKVVPVLDPLTIFGVLVPACFNRRVPYAFVIEDVPKEEYKAQYSDSEMASLSWSEAEKQGEGWVGSETVRIAEYWDTKEAPATNLTRKKRYKVKFCKTNGLEILADSETDWPGSSIPIIPVLGKQMIMEGKPRLFSVVRPQKSAQQLINYTKSRIAETLSTSPISPFMVAEGQIEGYEKEWSTLNTSLRPYLTYKMVDVAGRPIPAPQRQTFEPPIQALSSFVMQEVDDMKATTGIFDASLGNSANEVSGQAILRRKQQTDLTTMHFMDNLTRSFKKGGEIIAELIPLIYDTEREIEILGEDEASKVVKINKAHKDENGKEHHYDMTKGKYVPIVTAGQAFDSKRMESFDTMQQLVQSAPTMLPMFGDILFKNSDMAGADLLSERFKKMLPPNLQGDEEGQEKVPPQAQAQMQQLQQHGQALNAACQHYEQQIKQLQMEKQAKVIDNESRMAIEKMKIEAQLAVAEISTKAQNLNERIAFVEDLAKQFHAQAHDVAMQAQGAQHAQSAQAQQASNQQDLQSQQADAQSQQSAQNAQQQQAQQQSQPSE
jgi:hypothetical protein